MSKESDSSPSSAFTSVSPIKPSPALTSVSPIDQSPPLVRVKPYFVPKKFNGISVQEFIWDVQRDIMTRVPPKYYFRIPKVDLLIMLLLKEYQEKLFLSKGVLVPFAVAAVAVKVLRIAGFDPKTGLPVHGEEMDEYDDLGEDETDTVDWDYIYDGPSSYEEDEEEEETTESYFS